MARPETTRLDSLNVLLDGSESGKMLLKEAYDGVIENVQKGTVSSKIKNTDLSGDPTAGTVEAKRFVNASSQPYGTARTAAKGTAVKGKTVTVPINVDREFVEEIEEKDIRLLGVDGLVAKRSANHAQRMVAELDTAFFAEGKNSGTQFKPAKAVTDIKDIVESAILQLEKLKNNYIDGYSLDVEQLVYNELLVGWPTKILCSEDCKGICNVCGQNLNKGTCNCEDTGLDPRMSVIRDVFKNFKEV